MTRIWLITHALTQWNIDGRTQGHTDTPLNDTGREMARRLAERLRDEPIDRVYSSDLRRALETIEPLRVLRRLTVVADPRLREGRWAHQERHSEFPVLPFAVESETRDDVLVRVREVLSEIAEANNGRTVLVMTHGGATKWFMRWVLRTAGTDPDSYLCVKSALNMLEYDSGVWRVVSMNDRTYLDGLACAGSDPNQVDGKAVV